MRYVLVDEGRYQGSAVKGSLLEAEQAAAEIVQAHPERKILVAVICKTVRVKPREVEFIREAEEE